MSNPILPVGTTTTKLSSAVVFGATVLVLASSTVMYKTESIAARARLGAIRVVHQMANVPNETMGTRTNEIVRETRFVPKTELAKKLWAWRQAAIRAGEPMSPPLELLEHLRKSRE